MEESDCCDTGYVLFPYIFIHFISFRFAKYSKPFCFVVYPVPHKFVLTRKLIWFVHTTLGRQFFSGDRITS